MRQALRRAAQRGVAVWLLVPRVSDVRLAQWAANAIYAELLQSGVRVFEYLPRMLHAKTVVADGDWALVGTANLDYRSVFLNYELIVASRDPSLCRALGEQFEVDLAAAAEVEPARWHRRRWVLRAAEGLAWTLRRWL
jgi:cardiolipin synthase